MNFPESAAYLQSLGNEVVAMKLGLEKIEALLAVLGDPQNNYKKVQVAGTNGKGSVCAFLNSICVHAGIKIGLYTSPHLIKITERIKIDDVEISEDDFARLASIVRKAAEKMVTDGRFSSVPTFFEQVTAIALLAFSEAKVELAILETGIGGRLDAATAANAEICAITRIDIDHPEYLGETLAEIAAEKAAIIRPDSRVVIGEQSDAALRVVLNRCSVVGVEPKMANEIVAESGSKTSGSECAFRVIGAHSIPLVFPPVCIGLAGHHQVQNAKVAILLAEEINQHFPISQAAIIKGLENARHPGRLERIGRFLLDGAHNIGGVKALREYLDEFVAEPITLIFGTMRDKNVSEMARILWPRAARLVLTRPDNSRAMTASELAAFAPETVGSDKIVLTESVSEALEKSDAVSSENSITLVAGSLYLVGEVKKLLNN